MKKKRTSKRANPRADAPGRQRSSGPPVEAFADLDTWAGEVAACLPKDELGVLLGIFRRMASDPRVSSENRRLARKQAQALRKVVKH